MKRLFIAGQWILMIVLAGLLIQHTLKPTPELPFEREQWNSWDGFYAISFGNIQRTEAGDGISKTQLAETLFALRDHGFHPITPDDALAFLHQKQPLPDNAMMILFEGGRKSSILYGTPALRRSGFCALYGVPSSLPDSWKATYVRRKDISRLDNDSNWWVASMGHDAIHPIRTGKQKQGHFLSQKKWSPDGGESDVVFAKRIRGDYTSSVKMLAPLLKTPASFYLYPYGDSGEGRNHHPDAAWINREALEESFQAAFVQGDDPFNGGGQDPYALHRLQVQPHWSPTELIQQLQSFRTRREPCTGIHEKDWILSGPGAIHQENLRILPHTLAWLKGSSDWNHLQVAVHASPVTPDGAIELFLRYSGPKSYLKVHLQQERLQIQEAARGDAQTLFRKVLSASPSSQELQLSVLLKRNRLWVTVGDTERLGPFPVTESTQRGRLGLQAAGSVMDISSFTATLLNPIVIHPSSPMIHGEGSTDLIGAVTLPWPEDTPSPSGNTELKQQALRLISKGIDPFLLLPSSPPEDLNAHLQKDGLAPLIHGVVINGKQPSQVRSLIQQGFQVYSILDAEDELAARELLEIGPQSHIVLRGEVDRIALAVARLIKKHPPAQIGLAQRSLASPPLLTPWISSQAFTKEVEL